MPTQIACQLYTLRNFTKTADDLARTLARVKKIGYDAVQISAIGKMEDQVVADILKNEGLTCCATHVGFERMRDQTANVINQHKLWGCQYAAIGGVNYKSVAEWDKFIGEYNAIAKQFVGSGVQLGYHNHSHEMVKYEGKNPLDRMLEGFTQGHLDGNRRLLDHARRRRSGRVGRKVQRPHPLHAPEGHGRR